MEDSNEKRKTYRVGIVGLGRMGSTIDNERPPGFPPTSVAAASASSDRLDVVAGCDIDEERRRAFGDKWGVDALYEDYREMIRQEKPDLVAICTKGPLHAEMSVETAEAGVDMIFCEKAIACSMQEADAVLDAVGSRDIPFNTGVLRRFHNRYHTARRLIADGEIGEPRAAAHYAATNLLHGHIHSIDTLSYLLGDPPVEQVWGELIPRSQAIENNRLDKDPNAIYQVTFAGDIEAASIPSGGWEFEVLGDRGSVRVLNNGGGVLLRKAVDERGRQLQEVPVSVEPLYSPTQYCLEDLVTAYEEERQTLGHVALTHHMTEVCFAVAESHRSGQRVSLPLENRDMYIFHV